MIYVLREKYCNTTCNKSEEKYSQGHNGSAGNATIVVPRLMIELPLSRRRSFRGGEIILRTNIFVGTAQRVATLHRNWRQVLAIGVAFHTGGRPMPYFKIDEGIAIVYNDHPYKNNRKYFRKKLTKLQGVAAAVNGKEI